MTQRSQHQIKMKFEIKSHENIDHFSILNFENPIGNRERHFGCHRLKSIHSPIKSKLYVKIELKFQNTSVISIIIKSKRKYAEIILNFLFQNKTLPYHRISISFG